MSPTKRSQARNLYIGHADAAVWDQAERIAKHAGHSLSSFVTEVLRRHVPLDIRVVVDPAEAVTISVNDGPILEFGRHDPYGLGWLLSYPAPGGAAGAEVKFFPDLGAVPIDEARAHLRRVRGESESGDGEHLEKITVAVGEPPLTVGFVGRWLVEPHRDATRTSLEGYDAGAYWGVAATRRGRIAVYVAHCNELWPAHLDDYDSLDEAADDVPADIIAQAAAELGERHILWRDI